MECMQRETSNSKPEIDISDINSFFRMPSRMAGKCVPGDGGMVDGYLDPLLASPEKRGRDWGLIYWVSVFREGPLQDSILNLSFLKGVI